MGNDEIAFYSHLIKVTKFRRYIDPNGRNFQNEMKRYKGLNYLKQNCPIFRFAIKTFLRG